MKIYILFFNIVFLGILIKNNNKQKKEFYFINVINMF